MSFYPIGLVKSVQIERVNRVVADEFEAGNTSTRRLWPAQSFKRRFTIEHAPLNYAEWRCLRAFHAARDGSYDSFWFRDNLDRGGNSNVRFAGNLLHRRDSGLYQVTANLDAIAVERALPELEEVVLAAGATPLFFWDPQREFYFEHLGATYTDATVYDAASQIYRPAWQSGIVSLTNVNAATYTSFSFDGARWALTPVNVSLTGAQPAFSMFTIAKFSTVANTQILAVCGTAFQGLGIGVLNSNYFGGCVGNGFAAGLGYLNNPVSTWRSVAVGWTASSNSYELWVNGASIGSDATLTRSWVNGPAALGAHVNGTWIAGTGALTHAKVGPVLTFASTLTLAQVKALHNLFAHQFALTLV
jgi:hypothetical protein